MWLFPCGFVGILKKIVVYCVCVFWLSASFGNFLGQGSLPCRLVREQESLPARKQNRERQFQSSTETQKGIEKIELFFRIKEFVLRETADTRRLRRRTKIRDILDKT